MLEREGLQIKKSQIKECKEFLNEMFLGLGQEKIRIIQKSIYTLTKDNQFFKEYVFETNQALHYRQTNILNRIKDKINESKWADHDLLRLFKTDSYFQLGHKLESIPDIEKIFGEKEIRQFILEEGKVCLIYVWCYFKTISKKQLKHLEEIFLRNNWEGNVKFLTLNLNFNRVQTKKYIKNLNLYGLEHFYVDQKKHPDHPFVKFEEIYGSNCCILINNENIIDYCGNLYDVDFEERINLMLERNLPNSGIYQIPNLIDKQEKQILKDIVNNLQEFTEVVLCDSELDFFIENEKKYEYDTFSNNSKDSTPKITMTIKKNQNKKGNISPIRNERFCCDIENYNKKLGLTLSKSKISLNAPHLNEARIVINKHFTTGNLKSKSYSGEIFYKCLKEDEEEVLKLLNGLEKLKNINFSKEIVETIEFTYGETCNSCQCLLYDEDDKDFVFPQYYCPLSNIYFCVDCGNHLTNIESRQRNHNHFLYYLTNNTKNYMKFILKNNVYNDFDTDFKYFLQNKDFDYVVKDMKVHHHIKCDGCFSFPIKTYRWKCCNCEYRNICNICMNIIEKNIQVFSDEIQENLKVSGCNAKNHVFMKIVFDVPIYK
jgi:hypothetical protein